LLQRKYLLDILEEIGVLSSKLVQTFMDPNVKLYVDHRELLSNPMKYCHLFGKLNYLTITLPNISFVVSVESQYMAAPSLFAL
jgi:hypothetical protein